MLTLIFKKKSWHSFLGRQTGLQNLGRQGFIIMRGSAHEDKTLLNANAPDLKGSKYSEAKTEN